MNYNLDEAILATVSAGLAVQRDPGDGRITCGLMAHSTTGDSMNMLKALAVAVALMMAGGWGMAGGSSGAAAEEQEQMHMSHKVLFEKLIGNWRGTCRTWFEPGKLADESPVSGEFSKVLDGQFVRHTYQGTMKGKPRTGEELIAFNSATKKFQTSWVDSFHMNYAIMFSTGDATERGFSVRGEYDVGENQPPWRWRTEYELIDDDHLTITAYNITPDGMEAKAVETVYERVK